MRMVRVGLAVALVAAALVAISAQPARSAPADLRGTVRADGKGVNGATVHLMRAGAQPGRAQQLVTATTNRSGAFTLDFPKRVRPEDELYLTVDGGSLPDTVELATALGDQRGGRVTVNELTTVAAGYALAQFADAGKLGGKNPGLPNAMRMVRNLVDLGTGRVARFLAQAPNGKETETLANVNSLASIIAGCAAGTNDCDAFLDAATDAWGERPATTWQAITLLPTNPSGDPQGIFDEIPTKPRFKPVAAEAPGAWIVALRFYGNGKQFNGPGNVAFDANGLVWVNNNAEWSRNPLKVCPGLEIYHLDPYSPGHPMRTYKGGGLNGAGFGIALDPKQNVWVGNFGFTGRLCNEGPPTSNSVSKFGPNGFPWSGENGYTNGPLSWPQGVKSDTAGNIWIASCGNDELVEYPGGDHRKSKVVGRGVQRAFDVAQNTRGDIFVTANGGDRVYGFHRNGKPLPNSPFGNSDFFSKPLGAASDSRGNVWVANSGVITIPCQPDQSLEVPESDVELSGSITQVGPKGTLAKFEGGGLTIPWGIAVDGDDNVWVANFSGERLSHFCGANPKTCPTGTPGDPISGDDGYGFDGLQRNTGVQVDPSGNVWLANNWIKFPVQIDPFGDGLVVYLGMAAPVKAPLIGTPKQP